jgi:hypothetical protein
LQKKRGLIMEKKSFIADRFFGAIVEETEKLQEKERG